MSHSCATIVFENVVFYGEYNGTSDIIHSQFYKTPEERQANWRKDPKISVTKEMIERAIVIAFEASYGSGVSWDVLFDVETRTVVSNKVNQLDEYLYYNPKSLTDDELSLLMKDHAYAENGLEK